MQKLTKDQAAIIAAYTGYLIGDFGDMHEYVERKLNRPVFTHEFASKEIMDEIREACKEDFVALSPITP